MIGWRQRRRALRQGDGEGGAGILADAADHFDAAAVQIDGAIDAGHAQAGAGDAAHIAGPMKRFVQARQISGRDAEAVDGGLTRIVYCEAPPRML